VVSESSSPSPSEILGKRIHPQDQIMVRAVNTIFITWHGEGERFREAS